MASSPPALPPECARKFKVDRLLGSGGFGSVWLAIQQGLNRPVALKVLNKGVLEDRELVERFKNEALITASLAHPNIVFVVDYGFEAEVPWIAYEYLPLKSVRDVLTCRPLPWPEVVRVADQVAAALECAHAKGVLHRDIKPDNILVAGEGHYKVTDFGIARWTSGSTVRTATSLVLGTPAYLPPELFGGAKFSVQADLYALGVTLYELLTGRTPFDARELLLMISQIREAPVPRLAKLVPDVPPALEGLVMAALDRCLDKRPRSAGEVRAVLQRIEPRRAVAPSPPPVDPGLPTADSSPDPRTTVAVQSSIPILETVASPKPGSSDARQPNRPTSRVRRTAPVAAVQVPTAPSRKAMGVALISTVLVVCAVLLALRTGQAPPPIAAGSRTHAAARTPSAGPATARSTAEFNAYLRACISLIRLVDATLEKLAEKQGLFGGIDGYRVEKRTDKRKPILLVDQELLTRTPEEDRRQLKQETEAVWKLFHKCREQALEAWVPIPIQFQFASWTAHLLRYFTRLNEAEKLESLRRAIDDARSRRADTWIVAYLIGRRFRLDAEMVPEGDRRGQDMRQNALRWFEEADRRLGPFVRPDTPTVIAGKPEALLHILWEEHECWLELARRDRAALVAARHWSILDTTRPDLGEFREVLDRARAHARKQIPRPRSSPQASSR